ncbi:hypothetical protein [Roseovarius sp. S1116L3]|uniref:hypothetical protein n=1 Tax=Roseovarius roseus TaxID=3342636 RepID=UPI00372D2843
MALARNAPGASAVLTICSGTGPLSIVVDAEGQPMGAPHICPDCALAALGAILPGLTDHPVPVTSRRAARAAPLPSGTALVNPTQARARAPPVASAPVFDSL